MSTETFLPLTYYKLKKFFLPMSNPCVEPLPPWGLCFRCPFLAGLSFIQFNLFLINYGTNANYLKVRTTSNLNGRGTRKLTIFVGDPLRNIYDCLFAKGSILSTIVPLDILALLAALPPVLYHTTFVTRFLISYLRISLHAVKLD